MRHKHEWRELYRKPTNVGEQLAYVLRQLGRWHQCVVCGAVGLEAKNGRRIRATNGYVAHIIKDATAWNGN